MFAGISDAKEAAAENGVQINPWFSKGRSASSAKLIDQETKTPFRLVEFDVAVTTTESEQAKGGAGVMVAAIGIGGQLQSDATNPVVSRVKFSLPLALPRGTAS